MEHWGLSLLGIVALAAFLVLAGTPGGLADTTTDPFVVSAGSSEKTLDPDEQLSVDGEVVDGGQAPFTYAWTIAGSSDAFTDPTNASTTVDLSDHRGPVTLTFTVTDATNATATDTVPYHVAERNGSIAERDVTVGPGVPDDVVLASGVDAEEVTFTVDASVDALTGILTWRDDDPGLVVADNDLDLVLENPDGEDVTEDQGETIDHPEQVYVDDPKPGEWTARIEPFLSSPEDARLEIVELDSPTLPRPIKPGPKLFGAEEEQELVGQAFHNPAEAAAWDLDDDGLYEVSGERAIADKPVGTHTVGFRVVDADGYEAYNPFTFDVTDRAQTTVAVLCHDRPGWDVYAMEFSASGGTCWMHGGHHTFDLPETQTIVGGQGSVFSVEQQFSPPTEYSSVPDQTPIHVETSLDAQSWESMHEIDYQFGETIEDGVIGDDLFQIRQRIDFRFDAEDRDLRFLRIHEPRSAAQGLSGFLDDSMVYLYVNDTAEETSASSPSTEAGSLELSCEDGDVIEDFFTDHPCTFGGVNRYDAASFFHTYRPGEGTVVEAIDVNATVAPWRSDDFFQPLVLAPTTDALEHNAAQLTETRLEVQTSTDAVTWRTVATRTVNHLEPIAFELELDHPTPAEYVRLIPDEHANFDDHRTNAPDHHLEAFFIDSAITLDGDVPASS